MGKGDKKTKRGKINIGSAGVTRPAKKKKTVVAAKPKAAKKTTAKKATAKKTTTKKAAAKTQE